MSARVASSYTELGKSVLKAFPKNRSLPFSLIAIGVSTGGPDALAQLLPALPANIGVPIVLVQHMPAFFTALFAEKLNQKCALHVKQAEHGETLLPNTVYLAPGGRHLSVQTGVTGKPMAVLSDTEPVNCCRPSVDVLFDSLPAVYGQNVLSIILTGMGKDGLSGVRSLKASGSYCLTQTEQSCVIYGMPKAIDEAGLSDEQVHLNDVPTRIQQLLGWNR